MIGMIGPVLGRLKRDRRGILAVEMAIATPVVIGRLLSAIEVTRCGLLNQKIERALATMAAEPLQLRRLPAALVVSGDDQPLPQSLPRAHGADRAPRPMCRRAGIGAVRGRNVLKQEWKKTMITKRICSIYKLNKTFR